jgi:hypothetical protein
MEGFRVQDVDGRGLRFIWFIRFGFIVALCCGGGKLCCRKNLTRTNQEGLRADRRPAPVREPRDDLSLHLGCTN